MATTWIELFGNSAVTFAPLGSALRVGIQASSARYQDGIKPMDFPWRVCRRRFLPSQRAHKTQSEPSTGHRLRSRNRLLDGKLCIPASSGASAIPLIVEKKFLDLDMVWREPLQIA
jgi:hypothetical protein